MKDALSEAGGGVTLKDIARRCGVCKQTASRALLGDRKHVSEEKIELITRVAKEMGYNPSRNYAARRLALRKARQDVPNQVISLFLPADFYRISYFGTMFRGIVNVTSDERYGLLTNYCYDPIQTELPPIFYRGEVDGVIIVPRRMPDPMLDQILAVPGFENRPVVAIISPIEGCSAVLTDDYAGGYAAASHLLDLGHRHVLQFCEDDDIHPIAQRFAGYRQAYIDRGLDPERFLYFAPCRTSTEPDEDAVINVLRRGPRITAVLARNDGVATKCADLLRKNGLRVPEDVSLVGFNDAETVLNDRGQNILTTVRQPLEDVGREATKLLIRQINEGRRSEETITLPVELVVRASTAPPARAVD